MEKEKGKSCDTQAVKDINKSERSIKKATFFDSTVVPIDDSKIIIQKQNQEFANNRV